MSVIFEVRVPTYNRPDLLRRALQSLQSQTYDHWTATVYDDATSGADTVQQQADHRISYSRNVPRLGAISNIDQCFSSAPRAGGHYACLLEDDNFWLPDFLACIARKIEEKPWSLIQANQRIWSEGRGLHAETETTRRNWYSAGPVDVIHLLAATFFIDGALSNGGLVWRLDGSCNLHVGEIVGHLGLQEICRSLLVTSPFLFVDDALSVWSDMPKTQTVRANEDSRSFGRGMLSVRQFILRRHRQAVTNFILNDAGQRVGSKEMFLSLLAHSGYPNSIDTGSLKAFAKGLALRATQSDPCKEFLTTLP